MGTWTDVPSAMPQTGWMYDGSSWFYLLNYGVMCSGWSHIDGHTYYFNDSGRMVTGWSTIGGDWFYFDGSGHMTANTWAGDYYLGSWGAMMTGTQTPDGWYVDEFGQCIYS